MGINSVYKLSGQANEKRDLYLSYLSAHPNDKPVIKAWNKLKSNRSDQKILHSFLSRPDNYLVSAIVSTYQSEAFIRECLDNIEEQSIADQIEIMIVDAASPEGEGQIIRDSYGQFTNISYLRTKGRISVYAAWNLAIKASTGKYCISISTNDQLRQNACELLADYLEKNPDCMLVYGDTYLTREPHETFDNNSHFAKYEWPDCSFDYLLYHCSIGPHPMWRKAVHKAIGYFDERYLAVGDQEFWLRMGERYNLHHLKEFTGLQWITEDSVSSQGNTPVLEALKIHAYYRYRYNKKNG